MRRTLNIGNIVKLKIDLLGNPEGSLGVVYEIYHLTDTPGASVIFENGEYDGFSLEEQLCYLERVGHEKSLETYQFLNVMKLSNDFEAGIFDVVFE